MKTKDVLPELFRQLTHNNHVEETGTRRSARSHELHGTVVLTQRGEEIRLTFYQTLSEDEVPYSVSVELIYAPPKPGRRTQIAVLATTHDLTCEHGDGYHFLHRCRELHRDCEDYVLTRSPTVHAAQSAPLVHHKTRSTPTWKQMLNWALAGFR